MREADLLALAGQNHRVLAGIAACSTAWIPISSASRRLRPLAPMPHAASSIAATGFSHRACQRQGGPGRRIQLCAGGASRRSRRRSPGERARGRARRRGRRSPRDSCSPRGRPRPVPRPRAGLPPGPASSPVVPQTSGTPADAQASAWSTVPLGAEKSMSTSISRQQVRRVREQPDAIRSDSACGLAAQPADQRHLLVVCREGGDLAAHPAPNAGDTDPQRHGVLLANGAGDIVRPAPLSLRDSSGRERGGRRRPPRRERASTRRCAASLSGASGSRTSGDAVSQQRRRGLHRRRGSSRRTSPGRDRRAPGE